ncbi:hypothetical protein [Streptomyces sp. NPDC093018]|uniref:hypothetical protein n=1 Tax=Streptomyces sp. NPDC093018 TaxID=3155067 RepID=UPI00342DDCA5
MHIITPADELTELLGLRACRFEYGTPVGRPPRLENDGGATVGRHTRNPDTDDRTGAALDTSGPVRGW